MNKTALVVLIVAVAFLTSCSAPTPSPTPVSGTTEPRKSGLMRFSYVSSANVRDVPSRMAFEALREQGYTIEAIPFAKGALNAAALDKGDIEVSDANATLIYAAIAQGADLRIVANKQNMSFIFATTVDIDHCSDLEGKALAFSSRQTVGYVMFEQYVARNCPGIKPELLSISESANRVAALEAGQVVGAYLELEEWLTLQESVPGKYHVLIDFGREFPDVLLLPFSVQREWAQQNPGMLQDFIKALLLAQRSIIANPQLLTDGIVKYLAIEPAQARKLADGYLAAQIWDPNGGLDEQKIEATLQFLRDGGILTADLKIEDLADLSYLNAVLDELGRQ